MAKKSSIMVKTEYITIKNPSRKLEEAIRKIGVQKYLWLKRLCSDETSLRMAFHSSEDGGDSEMKYEV